MRIPDAIAVFFDHMRSMNRSERTIKTYHSDLRIMIRFLAEAEGITTVDQANREALVRYQAYLFTEYRNPTTGRAITIGTQSHNLAAVKSLFRYLVKMRHLACDPSAAIELPRLPKRLPRDILTEDEVERLLEAPDIRIPLELRDRAILELLYGSGLRKAELLSLRLYDVDFEACHVRVERGKGGDARVVPIPSVVAGWVQRYVEEVRPRLVGPRSGDALFLAMRGKPLSPSSGHLSKVVEMYADRAELAKNPKCHGLRHTYGSHLHRRGMDIRQIQKLLGHRSIESTTIYTKVEPQDLKDAFHRAHPRSGEEDVAT